MVSITKPRAMSPSGMGPIVPSPRWFVGVGGGFTEAQVCVTDADGEVLGERAFEHGGQGLSEMADWLLSVAGGEAAAVGVAIEVPRGPVVESLMERGFVVYSINPKQLDRFRDRISPTGRAGDGLGVADRRAPFPAAEADRPGDRRVAGVVAPEREPDTGAHSSGEPDAGAVVALLPAVPHSG